MKQTTPLSPCARHYIVGLITAAMLGACSPASQHSAAVTSPVKAEQAAMKASQSISERPYGHLADGTEVKLVTLKNAMGVELDVISYGGIITRLLTPDARGQLDDIVLGLDSLDDYVAGSPYFGALIGRYGNRIANGRFSLDGETFQLDTNDGVNHLHGGVKGFDKQVWDMQSFTTEHSVGVTLTLISPDGDQGYPGTLVTQVVYELDNDNQLDIGFSATTDKPTIINLTQHSYFNLAGQGDILEHQLMIPAASITPVGEGLIPTGEFMAVAGTPFDFRTAKAIGRDIEADHPQLKLGLGYDHNFVLKAQPDNELILAARVSEPTTGRVLEVLTVEPAVQFYSGNFLDGSLNGKGTDYGQRSGFCLEPQHHPDSPNQSHFPSTVLRPGQTYQSRIVYRFTTE
ncbi:aldose epimerase family protein [Bowmanella denitrificans]|uniref:aldose epimerase family protein n=1 Tax=Bowmanella denitrificans TaxID=366582 RepID=UPI000C99A3A8|nr:aldose epimerase family protein [Bowmanella denitrificans]